MSLYTSLALLVACAALLAGCEARLHRNNRRNSNDASIALGSISGSNVITLPVINLRGPDVIIGFPDNCAGEGLVLLGTELIVSNIAGAPAVDLVPDDPDNALSNVAIHCNWDDISRCLSGVAVASYQYCGVPLPAPTTNTPPTPSSTGPPSSTSSSSSEN